MEPGVSAVLIQCPYEGCMIFVAPNKLEAHKFACPNGPCICTDVGCEFSGSPIAFCLHLDKTHGCRVERILYYDPFWV